MPRITQRDQVRPESAAPVGFPCQHRVGRHQYRYDVVAESGPLTKDDLYDEVEDIISATDFIEKTEGAQLLFI